MKAKETNTQKTKKDPTQQTLDSVGELWLLTPVWRFDHFGVVQELFITVFSRMWGANCRVLSSIIISFVNILYQMWMSLRLLWKYCHTCIPLEKVPSWKAGNQWLKRIQYPLMIHKSHKATQHIKTISMRNHFFVHACFLTEGAFWQRTLWKKINVISDRKPSIDSKALI